jgi:hypothetical protein
MTYLEPASFEFLEGRRLMSSAATLVGGNLVIRGTAGADVISVQQTVVQDRAAATGLATVSVRINDGPSQLFDVPENARISVKAGAGNDTVTLGDDPLDTSVSKTGAAALFRGMPAGMRAVVDGGAGDDIISGGEGDDRMSGGRGDDRISGNGGDDRLAGNAGRDSVFGGDGDDRLTGGQGRDVFYDADSAHERSDFRTRRVAADELREAPLKQSLPPLGSGDEEPATPADWQTLAAGDAFTFRAPTDVQPVPVQGIDSLVGRYVSPGLEITFDYGWYSGPVDREGVTGRSVTVDGKSARLVVTDDTVAIHFPEVSGPNKLTMVVRLNGAAALVGEAILLSIDFP